MPRTSRARPTVCGRTLPGTASPARATTPRRAEITPEFTMADHAAAENRQRWAIGERFKDV